MARTKTFNKKCAEPTCNKRADFEYDNLKERAEAERRPWHCSRHTKPDDVLSISEPVKESVWVATKLKGYSGEYLKDCFWVREGETSGSGFIYGPGFKAFQEDFPEGTKILVRAEIVLPELLER